jgi:hypothetical protein
MRNAICIMPMAKEKGKQLSNDREVYKKANRFSHIYLFYLENNSI